MPCALCHPRSPRCILRQNSDATHLWEPGLAQLLSRVQPSRVQRQQAQGCCRVPSQPCRRHSCWCTRLQSLRGHFLLSELDESS